MESQHKLYPWLLGISVFFCVLLCYLYVTKPVIVTNEVDSTEVTAVQEGIDNKAIKKLATPKKELVPSDEALPGLNKKKKEKKPMVKKFDPNQLMIGGDGSGWESTNARMQHILSADLGDGQVRKLVLDVPVIYETRTMRWTTSDVITARNILTRLMVYESNLAKIKQEGNMLLSDWNQLLNNTVPKSSLRADSPSLPYNHTRLDDQKSLLDPAIKIER